jgi:hypothetical protein
MKDATTVVVRRACAASSGRLSKFYKVPQCSVLVLAARPLRVRSLTSELFGEYSADIMPIRVDANSRAQESHFFQNVSERALPRVVPASRFP